MAGVSALQMARGWIVSATSSNDAIDGNASQVEANEIGPGDSVYAIEIRWPSEGVRPRLDDRWWRRLDSFAIDYNDPRIIALLDQSRQEHHRADRFEMNSELADAAIGDSGIVELILDVDRPHERASVSERSNNLLIDMIHLERSRW